MPEMTEAVDPLAIPTFLRLSEAERAAGRARSATVEQEVRVETSRPGFKSARDVRRQQAEARKRADDERAAAAQPRRTAQGKSMVVVYRAGRYTFVFPTRLRKNEKHWTPETWAAEGRFGRIEVAPKETTKPKAIPRRVAGKLGETDHKIVALLRRPEGATADELAAGTGRKPHSCTCCFARYRRLGMLVGSELIAGRGRVYRMES